MRAALALLAFIPASSLAAQLPPPVPYGAPPSSAASSAASSPGTFQIPESTGQPAAPPPASPPALPPPVSVPAPVISPPNSWVPRDSATIRVLNKLDSTVTPIILSVGKSVTLQSLTITLKACAVRPPDLPEDATARLSIDDSQSGVPGFDGWILENEPAIDLFQDPVYDIQLAGCGPLAGKQP